MRLRNAALEAAQRGWKVIPLRPGHKQPITRHGIHDATDDIVEAFQQWERNPEANIGVVCEASGLLVIDIDPRHGGDETFKDLERTLGPLPTTVEAETGGGGWHYVFQHPGGVLKGKLGPGVDIKNHGYILIAPSLHPSGRLYEWSVDGHPDEVEPAELPERWVEAMQVRTRKPVERAEVDSPDPLRRIPAAEYVTKITGREPNRDGFWQCPIHGGGQERTPSFTVDGVLWCCHGCEPLPGQRAFGGNVYDLMGAILALPLPLRGIDYLEVKERLVRILL